MKENTKNTIIGIITIAIIIIICKGCWKKESPQSFADRVENNPQNTLDIVTIENMRAEYKTSPNNLQSSKISDRIDSYISLSNVVSWKGRITRIDKYELKITANGITFYEYMNADLERMVGDMKNGTRVTFSGKVNFRAMISYGIDFVSIYKDAQYYAD